MTAAPLIPPDVPATTAAPRLAALVKYLKPGQHLPVTGVLFDELMELSEMARCGSSVARAASPA